MITMMAVIEILRGANSSCDFRDFDGTAEDWMEMIQTKGNDTGFFRLVDSILENGWWEGSAVSYSNGHIFEGHHRLVAAILLGMDEVPVTTSYASSGDLSAHMRSDGPLGIQYF